MTNPSPPVQQPPPRPAAARPFPPWVLGRLGAGGRGAVPAALPLATGLLLVAVVALLDYVTGPQLSFSLFYLGPVLACAWWGGFAQGVLVALAGSAAWHTVDVVEKPAFAPMVRLW